MSTSPRRRVLFIGEVATLSHMVRPAVLAATLDPERYDVSFACDPRHLALLGESHPFRLVPLHSRLADKSMEGIANLHTTLYDYATVNRYVHEDLELFARCRPEVVVGDMRQSLSISTRLAGLPYVNVMNAYWHPHSDTVFESPVNPWARLVGEPWGSFLYTGFINAFMPLVTTGISMVTLQHGLPLVGVDFKTVFSYGDYVVFPDIPELAPLQRMPENAAYVGPCVWSPRVPPPAWWDQVPADRPVIYIGLGSSGQPRLLPLVLRALADLPVSLLVATAGRADLGPQPPSVFVADYLDGVAAAARAQLVICNGGSTSGPQSLAAGTPVLGITSNLDQVASVRRIQARGAGEMIPEAWISEEGVRTAAQQILGT
ncbi:MAG TPA: glycosyl transferase family 1, partial [Longimicrobium sp.]